MLRILTRLLIVKTMIRVSRIGMEVKDQALKLKSSTSVAIRCEQTMRSAWNITEEWIYR
jgi:hypothetical protein